MIFGSLLTTRLRYAYIQDQKAANLAHDLSNAVAVTVRNPNSKKQDTLQFDDIEVFDPCGTDQIDVNSPAYQGCAQLTSVMGVKTITVSLICDWPWKYLGRALM